MRALPLAILLWASAIAFSPIQLRTHSAPRLLRTRWILAASKGDGADRDKPGKAPRLGKRADGASSSGAPPKKRSVGKKKAEQDSAAGKSASKLTLDGLDDLGLEDYDFDSLLPFDADGTLEGLANVSGSGRGAAGAAGDDIVDEDGLEEALRSIEAGKFDLDTFLLPEGEDEMFSELGGLDLEGALGMEDAEAKNTASDLSALTAPELTAEDSDDLAVGAGVEAPPLEEFRRLMESLGPDSIFDEDGMFEGLLDRPEYIPPPIDEEDYEPSAEEVAWFPNIYQGGALPANQSAEKYASWAMDVDEPAVWRVQIVSVVTNSSANSTALDMVYRVYEHLRTGTNNDSRIQYQTICYEHEDGSAVEELDDAVQMWLEGYNTYHLVDGKAMKEAWGAIMPHIMLSEKNLNAILERVQWALHEDQMDGVLLTPRQRRIRFRGGAQEMQMGFNTEELDSEFSVVSVR